VARCPGRHFVGVVADDALRVMRWRNNGEHFVQCRRSTRAIDSSQGAKIFGIRLVMRRRIHYPRDGNEHWSPARRH
jgi:hypothetical protein